MNSVRCLLCETTLVSHFRHDYQSCQCPEEVRVAIDGGNEYHKRAFGDGSRWVELPSGKVRRGDELPETVHVVTPAMPAFGRLGYDAYAQSTGGKTFDGRDMPKWDELPERIQTAWNAAADAVCFALREHEGW